MTTDKDTMQTFAAQVPRLGVVYQPTQSEIRAALTEVLAADYDDKTTPIIPVHVYALIRDAFARANRGEFA